MARMMTMSCSVTEDLDRWISQVEGTNFEDDIITRNLTTSISLDLRSIANERSQNMMATSLDDEASNKMILQFKSPNTGNDWVNRPNDEANMDNRIANDDQYQESLELAYEYSIDPDLLKNIHIRDCQLELESIFNSMRSISLSLESLEGRIKSESGVVNNYALVCNYSKPNDMKNIGTEERAYKADQRAQAAAGFYYEEQQQRYRIKEEYQETCTQQYELWNSDREMRELQSEELRKMDERIRKTRKKEQRERWQQMREYLIRPQKLPQPGCMRMLQMKTGQQPSTEYRPPQSQEHYSGRENERNLQLSKHFAEPNMLPINNEINDVPKKRAVEVTRQELAKEPNTPRPQQPSQTSVCQNSREEAYVGNQYEGVKQKSRESVATPPRVSKALSNQSHKTKKSTSVTVSEKLRNKTSTTAAANDKLSKTHDHSRHHHRHNCKHKHKSKSSLPWSNVGTSSSSCTYKTGSPDVNRSVTNGKESLTGSNSSQISCEDRDYLAAVHEINASSKNVTNEELKGRRCTKGREEMDRQTKMDTPDRNQKCDKQKDKFHTEQENKSKYISYHSEQRQHLQKSKQPHVLPEATQLLLIQQQQRQQPRLVGVKENSSPVLHSGQVLRGQRMNSTQSLPENVGHPLRVSDDKRVSRTVTPQGQTVIQEAIERETKATERCRRCGKKKKCMSKRTRTPSNDKDGMKEVGRTQAENVSSAGGERNGRKNRTTVDVQVDVHLAADFSPNCENVSKSRMSVPKKVLDVHGLETNSVSSVTSAKQSSSNRVTDTTISASSSERHFRTSTEILTKSNKNLKTNETVLHQPRAKLAEQSNLWQVKLKEYYKQKQTGENCNQSNGARLQGKQLTKTSKKDQTPQQNNSGAAELRAEHVRCSRCEDKLVSLKRKAIERWMRFARDATGPISSSSIQMSKSSSDGYLLFTSQTSNTSEFLDDGRVCERCGTPGSELIDSALGMVQSLDRVWASRSNIPGGTRSLKVSAAVPETWDGAHSVEDNREHLQTNSPNKSHSSFSRQGGTILAEGISEGVRTGFVPTSRPLFRIRSSNDFPPQQQLMRQQENQIQRSRHNTDPTAEIMSIERSPSADTAILVSGPDTSAASRISSPTSPRRIRMGISSRVSSRASLRSRTWSTTEDSELSTTEDMQQQRFNMDQWQNMDMQQQRVRIQQRQNVVRSSDMGNDERTAILHEPNIDDRTKVGRNDIANQVARFSNTAASAINTNTFQKNSTSNFMSKSVKEINTAYTTTSYQQSCKNLAMQGLDDTSIFVISDQHKSTRELSNTQITWSNPASKNGDSNVEDFSIQLRPAHDISSIISSDVSRHTATWVDSLPSDIGGSAGKHRLYEFQSGTGLERSMTPQLERSKKYLKYDDVIRFQERTRDVYCDEVKSTSKSDVILARNRNLRVPDGSSDPNLCVP